MYFEYGEKEINHLKAKDKKPAAVIDRVGEVRRAADPDLFSSVVHHIVGQQISTKAQQTIWNRLTNSTGKVTPEAIDRMDAKELQSFGISFKKASYIKDFALKVSSGAFDINAVWQMPDEEAVAALSGLKGVGVWTAARSPNSKIALRQNAKCARTRFAVKDRKKQAILSRRAGIDATTNFPHSHLTRKNCKNKPQIHLPASLAVLPHTQFRYFYNKF